MSLDIAAGETLTVERGTRYVSGPVSLDGTLALDGTLETSSTATESATAEVRVDGTVGDARRRWRPAALLETRINATPTATQTARQRSAGDLRVDGAVVGGPARTTAAAGTVRVAGAITATPTAAGVVAGDLRVDGSIRFPELNPLRLTAVGDLRVEATPSAAWQFTPRAELTASLDGDIDAAAIATHVATGDIRATGAVQFPTFILAPVVAGDLRIDGAAKFPEIPFLTSADGSLTIAGDVDRTTIYRPIANGDLRIDGTAALIKVRALRRRTTTSIDDTRRDEFDAQGKGETE